MSLLLHTLLNAFAHEVDTARADLEALAANAIPSQHDLFTKQGGTPNVFGIVDAVNLVESPQGLGRAPIWGSLTSADVVEPDSTITLPQGYISAMRTPAIAMGTGGLAITDDAPHYWYAFVRTDRGEDLELQALIDGTPNGDPVILPAGFAGDWVLCRGVTDDSALIGQVIGLWVEAVGGAPDTGSIWMTGVTIVPGIDPEEPFDGDSPTTERNAYSWTSSRHGSHSRRHTQTIDLLALREATAQLDIAPVGWTPTQRRAYLLARRRARHNGTGETFVDLIVELVRTEDPTFDRTGVRIRENFSTGTYEVEIAYNPTGVLVERMTRLIEDVQPYPLGLTAVTWGTALADFAQADISEVF